MKKFLLIASIMYMMTMTACTTVYVHHQRRFPVFVHHHSHTRVHIHEKHIPPGHAKKWKGGRSHGHHK